MKIIPLGIGSAFTMNDYQSNLIQDCETSPFMSGVHAHYNELKTLDKATKAKMVLIYQEEVKTVKEDGFKGFCKTGKAITNET